MPKITELPALTTPGSTDPLAIVDNSGAITKKITRTNLLLGAAIPTSGFNDLNGNELFKVTATSSAVNEFTVANAATGNGPTLSSTGGDTNIDINLVPKGSGIVNIGGVPFNTKASVSYTPTWGNSGTANTIGSGTITGTYRQMGKHIYYRVVLTWGSGTAGGNGLWNFGLPVTAKSGYGVQSCFGNIVAYDTSASSGYPGMATYLSTTTVYARISYSGGTYTVWSANEIVNSNANVPFTWASGDVLELSGWYEAA